MKLKITPKIILSLFVLVSGFANAQEMDKIIEKHIKAHGGEEAIAKIQNLKIEGKFTAFSVEKDFIAYKTNKGEYYSELSLGQYDVVEAFDGENGWTIDPWQEILFPRSLNKAEVNVFMQKAEFFSPFYKYKERGIKVTYEGKEEVEGTKTHAFTIERKNGRKEKWYLDAKTYLPLKWSSFWADFAYPAPCESFYEDYREVNGVKLPFYVERTFGQRHRMLLVDQITANVEFDKSVLEMPRSPEMNKLNFLSGNFDVKVFMMTRRGTWHNNDVVKVKAKFKKTNLLKSNLVYDMYVQNDQTFYYSFNSDSKKYDVNIFDGLGSKMDLYQGEFTDTSFVVSNVNTKLPEGTPKTKYIYYDMSEEGYTILKQLSRDGENWMSREKFEFQKQSNK